MSFPLPVLSQDPLNPPDLEFKNRTTPLPVFSGSFVHPKKFLLILPKGPHLLPSLLRFPWAAYYKPLKVSM